MPNLVGLRSLSALPVLLITTALSFAGDESPQSNPLRSGRELERDLAAKYGRLYLSPLGFAGSIKNEQEETGLVPLPESKDLTHVGILFKNEAKYENPEKAMCLTYCPEGFVRGIYTYNHEKINQAWWDVGSISIDFKTLIASDLESSRLLKLKNLDLIGTDINKKTLAKIIASCPSLEMLAMPFVGISGGLIGIRYPGELKKLIIYNSILDEDAIASISSCLNLEEIVFYGCSVSKNFNEKSLIKIRAQLQRLELSHCSFEMMRIFMRKAGWDKVTDLKISSPYDWVAFDLAMKTPSKLPLAHFKYSEFADLKRLTLIGIMPNDADYGSKWQLVDQGFLRSKHEVRLHIDSTSPK